MSQANYTGTPQDIIRSCANIRLLTGQYRLQVDIAKQSGGPPTCQLCHESNDDFYHFLLDCITLCNHRSDYLHKVKPILSGHEQCTYSDIYINEPSGASYNGLYYANIADLNGTSWPVGVSPDKLPLSFRNLFKFNCDVYDVYETRRAQMFHIPRTKSRPSYHFIIFHQCGTIGIPSCMSVQHVVLWKTLYKIY